MIELHVCNSTGTVLRAFALGDADEVIIGRDDTCDIRILARSVSREHCSIERENGKYILRDLGSSGGTFAKGDKIERMPLEDGVEIRVGPAVLKFYENEV